MVTAYCYGPRTRTCPRQKGPFPAIFLYGGRERSISPPYDAKTRFAGFVVRTRRCGAVGRMPDERGPVRDGGNADGANLGAYPVCRFAPRLCEKRPGIKTQCWCGFAADSLPGLQKSAHERFAHRLTHRTHLYVTLYTRARVRASGEVTTTCVRCVRSAGVWARASRNWTPLATYQTTRYTLSPLSL